MDDIDFLPERIRDRRIRRSHLLRLGYLLLAFLCAVVLRGNFRQTRIATARSELNLLSDRIENAQQQLTIRRLLERQEAELMIKKRIDETLGTRVNALGLLAELEHVVPEQIVLTSLDFDIIVVSVPVEPAGRVNRSARPASSAAAPKQKVHKRIRLTLTGLAPSDVAVANFIGQLASSPLFEDVNMGYAKTVIFRKCRAREFQASCYVVK